MFPFHFRQRNHRFYFVRPGHVRNHRREIQLKLDRVLGVGIGAEFAAVLPPFVDIGLRVAGATLRAAFPGTFRIGEFRHARAHIIHGYFIEWKYACQRSPFSSHVGNGHARRHRKIRSRRRRQIPLRD